MNLHGIFERFLSFCNMDNSCTPSVILQGLSVTPLPGEGLFKISVLPASNSSIGKGKELQLAFDCAKGVRLLAGSWRKKLKSPDISQQEWVVKADFCVENLGTVSIAVDNTTVVSVDAVCSRQIREAGQTNPDFILYMPDKPEHSGNENVTVLSLGNGRLVAFWLQSACEQATWSSCVSSRSEDGGKTWTAPRTVAEANADPETGRNRINHTTAVMNTQGRIYLFLSRNSGDFAPHENGIPYVCFSDDGGISFSQEYELKFPHANYDDPEIPTSWITFQPPVRLSNGKYAGGVTKYASRKDLLERPQWTAEESCCEMYLIDNLDENPSPDKLQIRWTAFDHTALSFPHRSNPQWNVMQEPSVAELPDGRLFMVGRTNSGSPGFAVSTIGGESWSNVRQLCFGDGQKAIPHPLAPCPIYRIGDGEFVLFIHNHDGNFGPWGIEDTTRHRRPLYALYGIFDPTGTQPIRFADPMFFADNNGRCLGVNPRADMALYGSMTFIDGEHVLWYPDRKHFLCGKKIDVSALKKQDFYK